MLKSIISWKRKITNTCCMNDRRRIINNLYIGRRETKKRSRKSIRKKNSKKKKTTCDNCSVNYEWWFYVWNRFRVDFEMRTKNTKTAPSKIDLKWPGFSELLPTVFETENDVRKHDSRPKRTGLKTGTDGRLKSKARSDQRRMENDRYVLILLLKKILRLNRSKKFK